ncbi:MAG: glycosyltransferase family 39 protein [Anaerolineae bacterium]
MARYAALVVLLLLLWGSRLAALDSLPLHNDEGLHLTRAVEVWNGNPFWQINDGKIVNHWLIALFYPQSAPEFVGRVATVLVALIGLAAGYAIVRPRFGTRAALLAGAIWIASPYLFFYERLAFSDAQAGALVVLALWASLRLARTGKLRDALLMGVALALAALFKVTAVPYTLSVALVVLLLAKYPLRRRVGLLAIAAGVVALAFAGPLLLLMMRGSGIFDIAMGWIGAGPGGRLPNPTENLALLGELLIGFGNPFVILAMIVGPLALLIRYEGRVLVLAAFLPLAIMLLIGREVMPRHYVVALPFWLTLAGAGTGLLVERVPIRLRSPLTATALAVLAIGLMPTLLTANNPAEMPMPDAVRAEHLTEHSAGTGLREAMFDLPTRVGSGASVVASMFPDSCRRANFYTQGVTIHCTDAPGTALITALLNDQSRVYVLTDSAPNIGADVPALAAELGAQAERITGYPRPGESEDTASVVLWLIENS